jgi:hypothetical protein
MKLAGWLPMAYLSLAAFAACVNRTLVCLNGSFA